MNNINWDEFKCRCSAIHCIASSSRGENNITDKQLEELAKLESKSDLTEKNKERLAELQLKRENSKKVNLSDTYITYLMEEYSWRTQGMVKIGKELMDIPQLEKGRIVEPKSLELLSLVDGIEYRANIGPNGERERVYNDYLSGEVDAYVGDSIMTATKITDVKSIWDHPTFLCKLHDSLLKSNDWQVKGYMDISGAKEGSIANCLVDMPEEVILGMKWRLLNKMPHVATEESPEFLARWEILEHSMKFEGKIEPHKRVHQVPIEPMTEEQRQFVYDRVKIGREWLWKFDEAYQNLNK